MCTELQAEQAYHEITGGKVNHRAERRAQIETSALVPSLLPGNTSIQRVSGVFRVTFLRPWKLI
jgi:hypothetical protein